MGQQMSNHFQTNFCLQSATQVLEEQISKSCNFVASPLSLHFMLNLVASGSKGDTLQQLLRFLESKDIGELSSSSSRIVGLTSSESGDDGCLTLSFANGAWVDSKFSLKPSFEAIVKDSYKAEIKNVDFQHKLEEAVAEVNSWVKKETKGLIDKLISESSVSSDTALVLANALYFKGSWQQKFDISKTKERDFRLLNGKTVRAPFMTSPSRFDRQLYQLSKGFKVLQIPYQSGEQDPRKFSMYILLPDKRDGLPSLVGRIKSDPAMLNRQFETREEDLSDLWIPKFKFSFGFEASTPMKELGLQLLFSPGDLTEIVDCADGLFVSSMFHKACIEVNEEGTEAVACTGGVFRATGVRKYPSFVADHPFLFMIREETHNTVFFVGALLDPLKEK